VPFPRPQVRTAVVGTRLRLALAAALIAALGAACTPAPPPPAPPAAPARPATVTGTVRVPGSIDRSGLQDVSAPFARFLAGVPDGSTVEFARGSRYRMEAGLVVQARHRLTFVGNGATIFATTPGHLWRASVVVEDSSDIAFRDLVVRGANPVAGLADAAYQVDKVGQHGFRIGSARNVSLTGVTVTDTYGDLVYLGQRGEERGRPRGPWTDGVVIRDSRFARSGRQGITLVGARNVVIESNSITEARRATFDFEPLAAGAGVEGVVIRNNRIGPGRLLFVAAEGRGPVNDVTIEGNRLTGHLLAIQVRDLAGGTRRNWRVVGNVGDLVSGNPHGAAMRFFQVDGLEVRGNHQRFDPRRNMQGIKAYGGCNVMIAGNDFPGTIGQGSVEGLC
jgi:hypothetical protein